MGVRWGGVGLGAERSMFLFGPAVDGDIHFFFFSPTDLSCFIFSFVYYVI